MHCISRNCTFFESVQTLDTGESITSNTTDRSLQSPIYCNLNFLNDLTPISSPMPYSSDICCAEMNSPVMELDPMVNLFAFNTSPCNRSDYTILNNKANEIKSDTSVEPLILASSRNGYLNNHSFYNGTSTASSPHSQINSSFFPPNPSSSPLYYNGNSNQSYNMMHSPSNYIPQTSGVSYAIHPQIQMNSNNCSSSNQSGHNGYFNNSGSDHAPHSPMHFPTASMSVNLSMNMTMGFAGSDQQQVQWASPVSGTSYQPNYPNQTPTTPVSYHHHVYPSAYPSPSPTSYTFTAEFRPTSEHITLPPIEKEFAGVCNIKPVQSSVYNHQKNIMDSFHQNHTCKNGKPQRSGSFGTPLSQNCDPIAKNISNSTNLCRICGKTYARPSTLKTHLRTHSGERPYRCNTCNKSFSQAANLTAHIRTHSGEKPFRCPVCDRRFSQSSSVTTHMRTHSGERPYRCCMCKKAFSDSSTLTKHLRIHSGEKPYQCKLCLLRFSQSGNLNRHMRIHSNIS